MFMHPVANVVESNDELDHDRNSIPQHVCEFFFAI